MARPRSLVPTMTKHRSGQARVRIAGRARYLGPWGSAEALAGYQRLIAEIAAARSQLPAPSSDLLLAELAGPFLAHAHAIHTLARFRCIRLALKPLLAIYAQLPADEFGPLKLDAVRQSMIAAGLARSTINDRIDICRELFRWSAEKELIGPAVHDALMKVQRLRRGRGGREPKRVPPATWSQVRAIKPFVTPMVWRMVLTNWLTGMRSTELCTMTPGQIDFSRTVWVYSPVDCDGNARDKGAKLRTLGDADSNQRQICIGRLAQRVIRPLLRAAEPNAAIFRPDLAMADLRAGQRADRLAAGGGSGGSRKPKSRRRSGSRRPDGSYDHHSYARAIARACVLAGVAPWHPHQLRHSFATRARDVFDLEHSQAALGHAHARTAEIYALASRRKAEQVARRIG